MRVTYDIEPLLDRGTDGRGQTVVLMEFANTPQPVPPGQLTDIRQDLALFDAVFGLPAAAPQPEAMQPLAGSPQPGSAASIQLRSASAGAAPT